MIGIKPPLRVNLIESIIFYRVVIIAIIFSIRVNDFREIFVQNPKIGYYESMVV